MLNYPLYYLARTILAVVQALPLSVVARVGRFLGALVYLLDGRHRRVAESNLAMCFGTEKSPSEIKALARENFRRIGENWFCAAKTASMTSEQLASHLEISGVEQFLQKDKDQPLLSRVFAIGHFGNFELFASAVRIAEGYRGATTYRALKEPGLNRLLLEMRERSGSLFFERRTEGAALRAALRSQPLFLGLLADQHSGDHGVRIPFFGHECSTSKAPAVLAMRFNLPLHTSICYRVRPAQWRIEVSSEIPTQLNGHPRPVEDIMLEVNRAFEIAIRRDPANWFWVHKRWKPRKKSAVPVADEMEAEAALEGSGQERKM